MKIAIHGLGRMGSQIARKLAESEDMSVIAHNRSPEPIEEAAGYGAVGAYSKQEVVDAFEGQQVVLWLMLPAEIIDDQLSEWLAILPKGSLIIDGGNSDFRLTKKRSDLVSASESSLMDVGVSGGVWGYQNGFSMMAGADNVADFKQTEEALKILAAPEGDYAYFGPSGSGHFVKMTHNAIEYGMMESLAEGYRLLKEGPYENLDLSAASRVWQKHSVITSWLNQLIDEVMNENPELEGIDGKVAQSGEAMWALEVGKQLGIDMPAINEALKVRQNSQNEQISYATKLLSAMRNKFGGHNLNG
jgi:6-phosphogluconate dehydrogenase